MTTTSNGGLFAAHGKSVLENGYNVIPIEPGAKRPYRHIDEWQHVESNERTVKGWLAEGCGLGGVGINTRLTPAVDIDVYDDEVAGAMAEWCQEHIGFAPVRVGQPPKKLLLYKASEPFRKLTSKKFQDEWGDKHRIEILGDGQQFVAYHVHPDTQRPYQWTKGFSPLDTHRDELVELTANDARRIIEEFERMAVAAGWKAVSRGSASLGSDGDIDDPFGADIEKASIDDDELRRRLMLVPGADDYEHWMQVGMALFHQYEGDYQGLDMWKEWSSTWDLYEEKKGERACDAKWKTFDIAEKGRAPITARYILKCAKEAAETAAAELILDLRDQFGQVTDLPGWNKVVKEAKKAEIDSLSRATLAEIAKKAYTAITGAKIPIQEVRRAMAYELNTDEMPAWCQNWVYDAEDDKFFNSENKVYVTKQGFDAINDRKALTKKDILEGKTAPSTSASQLALNVFKVPTVHGRMYAPGRDAIFIYSGIKMANTYPENQVPSLPDKIRPMDKINIARVKHHIGHLLKCEREQKLLLSWLAYVVQNPGKRVNWAVLLQGTEGDGKSFFAFLLRAVMGIPNVSMLNASSFKNDFTGWAVGQCVLAVEELRLQGESKFDILNKIKPFITNSVIEIHAKGKTQFDAENTTNYMLFTNFRDALPLDDNDRRYFVLFSQWQSREALGAFKRQNPDYYLNLYGAIAESAPAIRKWLLDLDLDEEFDPQGDAPLTEAHDIMVHAAMPAELKSVKEIIAAGEHADICDELLNITRLASEMNTTGLEIPNTNRWNSILAKAGWFPLNGQVRVGEERNRFYSKCPEKFTENGAINGKPDPGKIRSFLKRRQSEIDAKMEL